jgi:ribonuclease HI
MKIIEIYTDGSSLGNPGKGGYGVVMTLNEEIIHEIGGYEDNTTNNQMELKAVIEALKFINTTDKLGLDSESQIIIHADSAYVLGGIESWVENWEKNGWRTANKKSVLNQELWKEVIELVRMCPYKLSFNKVKGHDGVLHNERADVIATTCAGYQECKLVEL